MKLATEVGRDITGQNHSNGKNFARKSVVLIGRYSKRNGKWKEFGRSDALQAVDVRHQNDFDGEAVQLLNAETLWTMVSSNNIFNFL